MRSLILACLAAGLAACGSNIVAQPDAAGGPRPDGGAGDGGSMGDGGVTPDAGIPDAGGPPDLRLYVGRQRIPAGGAYDFASTVLSRTASAALRVENHWTRAHPLALSLGGADSPSFSLAAQTVQVLAPGQTATVTLSFAPAEARAYEARLELGSETAGVVLFEVRLVGRGRVESTSPAQFVAVGYAGRRAVSADGTTWRFDFTEPGPGGDDEQLIRGVTYGNGRYVAVGGGGPQAGRMLWTVDGDQWHEQADTRSWLGGVAHGNGWFVAAGGNGRRIRSQDGETWVDNTIDFGSHFRAIAFGNGRFVAVGDSGRVATSTDGKSWSDARIPDPADGLSAVAFGAGKFVMVGAGGRRVSTADGSTWIDDLRGGTRLGGVCYGGGRFLAAGSGRTLTSADGAVWDEHLSTPDVSAVAYGNGVYVGLAWPDRRYSSTDGVMWTVRAGENARAFAAIAYGDGQ